MTLAPTVAAEGVDTSVASVIPLAALLTPSPLMWCEERFWNFNLFQKALFFHYCFKCLSGIREIPCLALLTSSKRGFGHYGPFRDKNLSYTIFSGIPRAFLIYVASTSEYIVFNHLSCGLSSQLCEYRIISSLIVTHWHHKSRTCCL
jgi:hypothetical protein